MCLFISNIAHKGGFGENWVTFFQDQKNTQTGTCSASFKVSLRHWCKSAERKEYRGALVCGSIPGIIYAPSPHTPSTAAQQQGYTSLTMWEAGHAIYLASHMPDLSIAIGEEHILGVS
jgi:hypothetical protein